MTPWLIIPAMVILGLGTCIPAFSQTNTTVPYAITIPGYVYTGNDYLEESNSSQQTYLAGIIDGFFGAAMFAAPERGLIQVSGCLKGKRTNQLHAIVARYLREHPERWDEPMSILTFNALSTLCGGF
jgi:hypothetical protein